MFLSPDQVRAEIQAGFPDAQVEVEGAGGKYSVVMVAAAFEGLNAVKRQQSVYKLLNAHLASGAMHAVTMHLQTPAEHAAQA